jgi:alkanesulfonate monooxygenase SsuD/methylene tetrahydromethanopterin reductase-like flavin-dependent oxidoreductase (luciferase family)
LDVILQGAQANAFTLREAGRRYGHTRMNPLLIGTPAMIADRLQDLFESACCDGFIFCPSLSPTGYEEFCQSVVPELQRRRIFRTAYAGTTFRSNLGET